MAVIESTSSAPLDGGVPSLDSSPDQGFSEVLQGHNKPNKDEGTSPVPCASPSAATADVIVPAAPLPFTKSNLGRRNKAWSCPASPRPQLSGEASGSSGNSPCDKLPGQPQARVSTASSSPSAWDFPESPCEVSFTGSPCGASLAGTPRSSTMVSTPGSHWVDPNRLAIDLNSIARHRRLRRATQKDDASSPEVDLSDKKAVRAERRQRLQAMADARVTAVRVPSSLSTVTKV